MSQTGVRSPDLQKSVIVDSVVANAGGSTANVEVPNLAAQMISLMGPQVALLAALTADRNWPARSIGWVLADGENTGLYQKSGAVGAGSWTRIADLPQQVVRDRANHTGTQTMETIDGLDDALAGKAGQNALEAETAAREGLAQEVAAQGDALAGKASLSDVEAEAANRQEAIEAEASARQALGAVVADQGTALDTKASQASVETEVTDRKTMARDAGFLPLTGVTVVHDDEAQETRISATILSQPWSVGATIGIYSKVDLTPTANNRYKVLLSINGGPFEPVRDSTGAELEADEFKFQVSYLLRRRGGSYRTYDDATKTKNTAFLKSTSALSWGHSDFGDGRGMVISTSGTGYVIGWRQHTVRGQSGIRLVDNLAPTFVDVGEALYVDATSTATPLPIQRGTGNAALFDRERAGEIRILVYLGQTGRIDGLFATSLRRVLDRVKAYQGVSGTALAIAQSMTMPQSYLTGRRPFEVRGGGWYPFQPTDVDSLIYVYNTDTYIDLEWLPLGRVGEIDNAQPCYVYAGDGSTFLGQVAGVNRVRIPRGYWRVKRLRPGVVALEQIVNAQENDQTPLYPVYSTFTRPAMARSILLAGQSQNETGSVNGAIGGFTNELWQDDRSRALSPEADKGSKYWIRAAVGGSAACRTSVGMSAENYWWDDINGTPGPLLIAAVDKINAAVAAGQPLPSCMIWKQGEGDGFRIETGVTSFAKYKAAVKAIWDHLRGVCPDMAVIACPPGSAEDTPTFKGMLAVRVAYLELTQENAWAHYGSEMYDVLRCKGDVHPSDDGYFSMGIRDALAYQRVMNGQAVDQGPVMTKASLSAATGVIEVVISGFGPDGKSDYALPLPKDFDEGPNPYGISVVVGDPCTNEQIPMLWGTARDETSGSKRKIVLTLVPAADPSGAQVYAIAGYAQHMWRRTYPYSDVRHGRSLGLPLRFGRTTLL